MSNRIKKDRGVVFGKSTQPSRMMQAGPMYRNQSNVTSQFGSSLKRTGPITGRQKRMRRM